MSQKNITRFATEAEYNTAFDTLSLPNVSYIDEGDIVKYMDAHQYIITGTVSDTSLTPRFLINCDKETYTELDGEWVDAVMDGKNYTVRITKPITNCAGMFCSQGGGYPQFAQNVNIESIVIPENFDMSKATNMYAMFRGNLSTTLKTIDGLQYLDTKNVRTMKSAFSLLKGITTIDLSNFNTENVTDMSYMFNSCSSLTTLDVSNFNTENVTNMNDMFENCSSLTAIKLFAIGDGTKSVGTDRMFTSSSKLANIPTCGDIHNSIDFSPCPLTLDSAKVVLNALSTPYSGAQTLTFGTSTKKLVKANAEAMTIVTEKRAMGWTISL